MSAASWSWMLTFPLLLCVAAPARADAPPEQGPRTAVVRPTDMTVHEIVALESAQPPPGANRGERLDEAVGLQWALVQRRHSDRADSGPPAPPRPAASATAAT